jgi:hypothetical protein
MKRHSLKYGQDELERSNSQTVISQLKQDNLKVLIQEDLQSMEGYGKTLNFHRSFYHFRSTKSTIISVLLILNGRFPNCRNQTFVRSLLAAKIQPNHKART